MSLESFILLQSPYSYLFLKKFSSLIFLEPYFLHLSIHGNPLKVLLRQFAGPTPGEAHSIGFGWFLRLCISVIFLVDTEGAGPKTRLWIPLCYRNHIGWLLPVCNWTCSFTCISCKFVFIYRGLIIFRFSFLGKNTSYIVLYTSYCISIMRHLMSGSIILK